MPGKAKEQKTNMQVIRYNNSELQFSPDEEQAKLQIELRELARELASGLSNLEPTRSKELLGSFVSELFFCVAEQERRAELRRKQAEGIAAAKAREVRFGAARKPLPEKFGECCDAWRSGQLTLAKAAAACGMPKSSFYDAVVRKERTADYAASV